MSATAGPERPWFRRAAVLLAIIVYAAVTYRMTSRHDWLSLLGHSTHLVAAIGLEAFNFIAQFWLWWFLARQAGGTARFTGAYRQYTIATVSRYLPLGKLAQATSFAYLEESAPSRLSPVAAYGVATLGGFASTALIAGVGIPLYYFQGQSTALWGFFGAGILVFLLAPWRRFLKVASPALKRIVGPGSIESAAKLLDRRTLAGSTVFNTFACWLPEGLSALCLLHAIDPAHGFSDFGFVLCAYALATLGGALALFAPAGIGVRESALVLLLHPRIGTNEAVLLAMNLRIVALVAEMLVFTPGIIGFARQHGPATETTG